jgi:tetratricopeptide (TPR) repeat protein
MLIPWLSSQPLLPRGGNGLRWLLIGGCLLVATSALADSAKGWNDLGLLLFRDARRQFAAEENRSARLGESLALLNLQPRTVGNINRARAMLEGIRAENRNDEDGIASTYHLARLLQLHLAEPDLTGAAQLYRELMNNHPGHPLSQQAVVKLAITSIFAELDPAAQAKAAESMEGELDALVLPSAERDLCLALGQYYLRWADQPERALTFLLRARKTGSMVRTNALGDLLMQIGELARELGKDELAREHYRLFLEAHPRDARAYLARQRLHELNTEGLQ